MGCLYLMECEGYTKIGVSTDPDGNGRLRIIQGANPFLVKLVKSFEVANARQIELRLHQEFDRQRVRGEWFRLSDSDMERLEGIVFAMSIPMGNGVVDLDKRSPMRKEKGAFDDMGLQLRSKNRGAYGFFIGYKQIKELGYVYVAGGA